MGYPAPTYQNEELEREIKRGFLRKVYSILSCQLLCTVGICWFVMAHPGLSLSLARSLSVGSQPPDFILRTFMFYSLTNLPLCHVCHARARVCVSVCVSVSVSVYVSVSVSVSVRAFCRGEFICSCPAVDAMGNFDPHSCELFVCVCVYVREREKEREIVHTETREKEATYRHVSSPHVSSLV